MKKTFSLLLVFLLFLCLLTACGGKMALESESKSTQEAFSEFQWPDSEIAKLLPVPESNVGKIDWERSSGFVIHVGETSAEQYDAYVEACIEKGFTVDASKGNDFYYANNKSGYKLSLRYELRDMKNTMTVQIGEPEENASIATSSSSSKGTPAPSAIGTGVKIENDDGQGKFTATIKVVEVLRGENALSKIERIDRDASEGYEIALVKISVTIDSIERNVSDKDDGVCVYDVSFKTYTKNNEKIDETPVVSEPNPVWVNNTLLKVGDTKEGYNAFIVKKDDPAPKLGYNVKYDGTGGYWFALTV